MQLLSTIGLVDVTV
uniref:Uncharacterized protein n=1 Tax=Moniliophthora roreri TaxID=221103 RepID=A0A0W0G0Q1_MONRR